MRVSQGIWLRGVATVVCATLVLGLWAPHDLAAAMAAVTDDIFPLVPERVTLTLAGHTHGGQVRLPWLGSPIVPSRFGQRFAAGHVVEGGRHLFVATGVGTSIVPVRFRVPPAVTILSLESEHRDAKR